MNLVNNSYSGGVGVNTDFINLMEIFSIVADEG